MDNNLQEIYKGIAFDGTHGYFSDGRLVCELTRDEYYKPKEWHEIRAKRLDCQYTIK